MVLRVMSEYDRAIDFDRRNSLRSFRNWRAYFAIDGGQWPDKSLQKLVDADRHAATYNIIGPKVDTLAGSLASEVFDLDWKPVEGIRNSLTEAVKTSYYSDKDLCNYEKQVEDVTKDAMIYRGVMKMEMSDKHNPLRNICFRRVTPGFFLPDPHWISDDDNDLEKCWEVFHLTAMQVKNVYGVSSSTIEAHIKNDLRSGDQYEEEDQYSRFHNQHITKGSHHRLTSGSLHKVIEFHYMENIATQRIIGQIIGSPRWIPFPLTNEEEALEKFMVENKVDPLTMKPVPYKDRVHHVVTVAPSLKTDGPLQEGISEIQTKRLPYIILSANRAHGQDKGIVDDIIDIQQTINKRESKLTNMIDTATGGGKLVNKDLFKTADQRKRFESDNAKPDYVEFVDGDEMSKERAVHYLNNNQFPSTLINQLERMWEIIDRVSKVPAAMDAISGSANESGILFDRKLEVSRLGLVTIINRVKNFRKTMAEMYYEQWQLSYNGPERMMAPNDGDRQVILNKRVFDKKQGRLYIENRPDQIPRSMVIVRESKSSPNRKMRDRAVYSELFNLSTQANPEYTSFFFQKLIETMDLSDEDKVELDVISSFQKIRDRKRLSAEISTLDSQEKQAALTSLQSILSMQQLSGGGGEAEGPVPTSRIPADEIPSGPGGEPAGPENQETPPVGEIPGRPQEANPLALA